MILKKTFFKLINNAVFGKTMKNVRKHSDKKLVTTKRRRNYLVSEPNCHKIKFFTENLFTKEIKKKKNKQTKTEILTNEPIYLGLSVLDLSKTLMYEF